MRGLGFGQMLIEVANRDCKGFRVSDVGFSGI